MSTTLPAGLPGVAVSPDGETVHAVDSDDGNLRVRYLGTRDWRVIPDARRHQWRFQPAKAYEHGWYCDEGDQDWMCADCHTELEWQDLA